MIDKTTSIMTSRVWIIIELSDQAVQLTCGISLELGFIIIKQGLRQIKQLWDLDAHEKIVLKRVYHYRASQTY
jgi:hypothetical protein